MPGSATRVTQRSAVYAGRPSMNGRLPARPLKLARLPYGGDYNPDQWSEAVQEEDARLMRLAHWNIATLPVFSWAHLNPSEGVFTFDWLDKTID